MVRDEIAVRLGAALMFLSFSTPIFAQPCTVPSLDNHELFPVWGGETWATYSEVVGSQLRIWTGEDGGRLRTSLDGGVSWVFADTPDDFTGSIFDIWFFPGGVHGFATGRGGHVLETVDSGLTWSYFGSQVLDAAGDPATLWGVRGLGNGIVLVSGLWTVQYTANSGTNASKVV